VVAGWKQSQPRDASGIALKRSAIYGLSPVATAERGQVLLVGAAVGGGIVTIGPMLVFALLFLPPLFAVQGKPGVLPYLRRTVSLGLISVILSWPASVLLDLPFGSAASLVCLLVGCVWVLTHSIRS